MPLRCPIEPTWGWKHTQEVHSGKAMAEMHVLSGVTKVLCARIIVILLKDDSGELQWDPSEVHWFW